MRKKNQSTHIPKYRRFKNIVGSNVAFSVLLWTKPLRIIIKVESLFMFGRWFVSKLQNEGKGLNGHMTDARVVIRRFMPNGLPRAMNQLPCTRSSRHTDATHMPISCCSVCHFHSRRLFHSFKFRTVHEK